MSISVDGVPYDLPLDESQAQKVASYNAALIALAAALLNVQTPKKARVYHSTTQSIPNNAVTAVSFDSERFDTDTIHDTSSNNSRLTCKTAGLYAITANIGFAANATGTRSIALRIGGSTFIAAVNGNNTGAGAARRLAVSTLYQLAVNDYVEVTAFQDSGGALNTEQQGNICPEFMMVRIGA